MKLVDGSIVDNRADDVYNLLYQLDPPASAKLTKFYTKHARYHENFARYIVLVLKHSDASLEAKDFATFLNKSNDGQSKYELDLEDVYGKLGWNHLVNLTKRCQHVKRPEKYRLF